MLADPEDDRMNVVRIMEQCATKLPTRLDIDFWAVSLLELAELYTAIHRKLTPSQKGVLLGFGGLLIGQMAKEHEATTLSDQIFDRVRERRGHAQPAARP